MENTTDINEQLRRAEYTRSYWSSVSSTIVQELYGVQEALNRGNLDFAKLRTNFLLRAIVEEGDKRNSCIEFIEGLIAFHALPKK